MTLCLLNENISVFHKSIIYDGAGQAYIDILYIQYMHATVQTSIVSLCLESEIIPVSVSNCQSNLEKQKQRGMFELNYNFTDDL